MGNGIFFFKESTKQKKALRAKLLIALVSSKALQIVSTVSAIFQEEKKFTLLKKNHKSNQKKNEEVNLFYQELLDSMTSKIFNH